jgi:SAM-dependent methyltransferase
MIKFIIDILNTTSKNSNYFILKWLLIITLIYIGYLLWRRYNNYKNGTEGFTQNENYVLKRNADIYDDFYAEIYDDIHKPKHRIWHELLNVINTTEPTTRNSVFLDIGSGTGDVVKHLHDAGYRAFGIDKSKAMIEMSEEKHPECNYKQGDVVEPMSFEHKSFSHILCTYFTIYHFPDKLTFFRNCHQWLMPNGYLVLHLIDADKFDAVSPSAKANLPVNPNKYSKKRITKSAVKFNNFTYNLEYDYRRISEKELYRTEKFQDKTSGNVRENEELLYVDTPDNILKLARHVGFNIYAQFNMKDNLDDEHQFIYILERI